MPNKRGAVETDGARGQVSAAVRPMPSGAAPARRHHHHHQPPPPPPKLTRRARQQPIDGGAAARPRAIRCVTGVLPPGARATCTARHCHAAACPQGHVRTIRRGAADRERAAMRGRHPRERDQGPHAALLGAGPEGADGARCSSRSGRSPRPARILKALPTRPARRPPCPLPRDSTNLIKVIN